MVGDVRHHIRLEEEVDEGMRRIRIRGVGGDREQVEPDLRPFLRRNITHRDAAPRLRRPQPGLDHVARIAEGEAGLPGRHRLDRAAGGEIADEGADGHQRAFDLAQVAGIGAVRVLAEIAQHGRDHVDGAVHHGDAAARDAPRMGGIQQQRQAVERRIRRQRANPVRIHAKTDGAPQIERPEPVAGIGDGNLRLQSRVYIPKIRHQRAIQGPEGAGPRQAREGRLAGGHDDVIAAAPRRQAAFQGLQAVEDVVAHADAGLAREALDHVGVDIIVPIEDVDDPFLRHKRRGWQGGGEEGGKEAADQHQTSHGHPPGVVPIPVAGN